VTVSRIPAFLLVLLTCWSAAALAQPQASDKSAAPGAGFIYGTVTWPNGEAKTGFLRWGDEEAFWDDLFHCGYRHNVWAEHADLDQVRAARRAEYFATHNLFERLTYSLHEDKDESVGWRMFLSRFGDLRSIEIHDGADDFAVTADGARHQIGGYANDAGSRLELYVGQAKPERIRWNDLSGIVFSQAPDGAVPYADRLYGRLEATHGTYEGFIQWDTAECTSDDVLDGKEGTTDLALKMGEIRSITRARDNSAEVVLQDGTRHNLRGTDDVGSGNRGIMVEVAGLGRVTVPWKRFTSLTFSAGHGSGPARVSYNNAAPLQGQVTDVDGRVLAGRLVFDLDEAWLWDLYNGRDADGLDYNIPFLHLARIESRPKNSCRVTLRGGQVLDLGEDQDTGRGNAGVLVFGAGAEAPEYLAWSRIRSVEFRP
jgi:hypothetical protein